jgi:hypothetical protein
MGSGISKLNHNIYIPEELENDNILKPLIDKIFNKKININAVYVLIRNHRFSMHNKIRIILVRYLTLHTDIPPNFFIRIASILDFVNIQIEHEYQVRARSHYYPEEVVEPPPPRYTEG